MSFKLNLLIFLIAISIITLSIVLGVFGIASNFVKDLVAEVRAYLTVYTDGSWDMKVINDFSSDINVTYLSVNIDNLASEVHLLITIPGGGLHTFNSGDLKTSGGTEGVTYISIVQLFYERNGKLYKSTRRFAGSFKEIAD